MKTTPWTPPTTPQVSFSLDDTTIFSSSETKVEVSGKLLSALLAGAAYAGRGLPFQIFDTSRQELLRFTPGSPIQGLADMREAMFEIAMHMDKQVRDTLEIRTREMKEEVMAQLDGWVEAAVAELRPQIVAEVRAELTHQGSAAAETESADGAPGSLG